MLEQQKVTMDAILAKLQMLNKTSPHGDHDNSGKGLSGSENKKKKDGGSKEENIDAYQSRDTTKDKVLEDILTNMDVFMHKDTLQEAGIMHLYLPEWDLIPFLKIYQVPNIDKYHRKGSPNQHFYHFNSLIWNAIDMKR